MPRTKSTFTLPIEALAELLEESIRAHMGDSPIKVGVTPAKDLDYPIDGQFRLSALRPNGKPFSAKIITESTMDLLDGSFDYYPEFNRIAGRIGNQLFDRCSMEQIADLIIDIAEGWS